MPAVYKGNITVAGVAQANCAKCIYARINDYTSDKGDIASNVYGFIQVAPRGAGYVGRTIEFWYVDPQTGKERKANETRAFTSGEQQLSFNLTVP